MIKFKKIKTAKEFMIHENKRKEGEYDTSRNKNGVVCESGDADSATLFSRFRRE